MKRLLIAAALVAATGAIAQSAPTDYAEIARLRDLNRGMQAVRRPPTGNITPSYGTMRYCVTPMPRRSPPR